MKALNTIGREFCEVAYDNLKLTDCESLHT